MMTGVRCPCHHCIMLLFISGIEIIKGGKFAGIPGLKANQLITIELHPTVKLQARDMTKRNAPALFKEYIQVFFSIFKTNSLLNIKIHSLLYHKLLKKESLFYGNCKKI